MENSRDQARRDPTLAPAIVGASRDWPNGLPHLTGTLVTLREPQVDDAPALLTMLSTPDVSRFISPPPGTVEGFERFILWARRQRAAGQCACFSVSPRGSDVAVGLFQVRFLEPSCRTAEWGFALGSDFWGSGMFVDGGNLVLDFLFDTVGIHRLEARAAVRDGRGNGALRKIGAVQEGVLCRSFFRRGEYLDQSLWSILDEDRRAGRAAPSLHIVH